MSTGQYICRQKKNVRVVGPYGVTLHDAFFIYTRLAEETDKQTERLRYAGLFN